MKTHNVGIVGLGSIGLRMLEAFVLHDRFEVLKLWDPSDTARKNAHRRYPRLDFAASEPDFYATPGVDVVYLACPPATHYEHATKAIAAGKAIHCEKPLGVDLADSEKLVAEVEASGLPHSVNLLYGAARAALKLEHAFDTGEVGDCPWVDIHLHLPLWAERRYAEAPWLMRRAQGGFVREVTTHYLFLCRRLFGDLTLQSCNVAYPGDGQGAVTFADVLLTTANTRITLTGSTLGAGPDVVHVNFWGTNNAYRLRDLHHLDRHDGKAWLPAITHEHRPELDTYFGLLDNLARMLEGEDHRLPDFREVFATQQLVETILAG